MAVTERLPGARCPAQLALSRAAPWPPAFGTAAGISPQRPPGWLRNTAEPSGELSVGDVVAVGEAGLAVGHVGWTLVRGGLNEVRTDEHGTHPLPPDAQRGTGRLPSQEGQDDATRD